jgi:hypothetical protein
MKKQAFLNFLSCVVLLCFITGCSLVLQEPAPGTEDIATGLGRVHISLTGMDDAGSADIASRTMLPQIGAITYTIIITLGYGDPLLNETITEFVYSVELPPDTYTVRVTARDSGSNALAEGSASLTVTENATTMVTVALSFLNSYETGTLRYAVNIPDEITVLSGSLQVQDLSNAGGRSGVNLSRGVNGDMALFSGYYRITLSIIGSAGEQRKTYKRVDILHMLPNYITEALYTLDLDNFLNGESCLYYVGNSAQLSTALADIKNGSDNDVSIMVTSDFASGPLSLTESEYNNKVITLVSDGTHTISLSGNGALFTLGSYEANITFVLKDITLKGKNENTSSLVSVNSGCTFVMLPGSAIRENNLYSHSYSAGFNRVYGGGVYVSGGIFVMKGGTISDNIANSINVSSSDYALSYGGGVYITDSGAFIMTAGTISGNTAGGTGRTYGGGICVSSSGGFTMHGGTISGNVAGTAYSSPCYGGGIYVEGTFIKTPETGKTTSGIIYGSDGGVLKNTGTGRGDAVYFTTAKFRNTTVGETTGLSSSSTENWTD